MIRQNRINRLKSHRGISLVEILVALVIGLILVSGVITLVVNIQQSNRIQESLNVRQDNGRVAIDLLNEAIINAGHWAGVDSNLISPAAGFTINAAGNCDLNWLTDTSVPIQGHDGDSTIGGTDFPSNCIAATEYVANTDILVVRYADPSKSIQSSQVAATANANEIVIRTILSDESIGSAAQIFAASAGIPTAINTGDKPGAYNFVYRADIYFITTCCGDDRPALARRRYNGTAFETEVLVEFVEQFQLAFASDTDGDFAADRYDSPTNVPNWNDVIGVSIDVVIRNDQKGLEFTDDTDYDLVGGYTYEVATSDENYRRKVYSKAVNIRNINRL